MYIQIPSAFLLDFLDGHYGASPVRLHVNKISSAFLFDFLDGHTVEFDSIVVIWFRTM
jgi:hypothetical protein